MRDVGVVCVTGAFRSWIFGYGKSEEKVRHGTDISTVVRLTVNFIAGLRFRTELQLVDNMLDGITGCPTELTFYVVK